MSGTPGPDPDKVANMAARARALARTPTALRGARDSMPGFEHRAVKKVVEWSGVCSIPELKRESARWGDDGLFTFAMFHAACEFPVRLTAGRLRFHFDGLATQFFNDPAATPVWSAYADARKGRPTGRLALVFSWPRVKKCGNLVVFHDAPRDDAEVEGASRRKGDPRLGFRLTVPIAGRLYHLEPLPAFLFGIGRYKVGASEVGDEGD